MVRILSAVKWEKMKKLDAVLKFNWYNSSMSWCVASIPFCLAACRVEADKRRLKGTWNVSHTYITILRDCSSNTSGRQNKKP